MTDETAPLDPIDAVAQLSFAVHERLAAVAAAHELSVTQLRLLGILRDREPAMLDLARYLNLSKSSVTGLIDRAQRRGLVARSGAAHDGRSVRVHLTAEGRRLTDQLGAEADRALTELLGVLPDRDSARLSVLAESVVRAQGTLRLGTG